MILRQAVAAVSCTAANITETLVLMMDLSKAKSGQYMFWLHFIIFFLFMFFFSCSFSKTKNKVSQLLLSSVLHHQISDKKNNMMMI